VSMEREFGRLEAQVEALTSSVEEIKGDTKRVLAELAEKKGERRIAIKFAGVVAAVVSFVAAFLVDAMKGLIGR
jgi:hypothetical protein